MKNAPHGDAEEIPLPALDVPLIAGLLARSKLIHGDLQRRFPAKLVDVHPQPWQNRGPPVDAVRKPRRTPKAECVDLICGDGFHHLVHSCHILHEAICSSHADALQIALDVWLLTGVGDDKLVAGPHGHGQHWKFAVPIVVPRVVTDRVVDAIAHDRATHAHQHPLHLSRNPRNGHVLWKLQCEVNVVRRLHLETDLHADLPQAAPPVEVPAAGIITRSLLLRLVGGSVHRQRLCPAPFALRDLRHVCAQQATRWQEGPTQWIVLLD
mmetsp:Transcript_22478/g.49623  ORF Transcript_22478/g.49623 Transcript_22478/m.49623 type:complete len:267 (-) Transcript_22478:313-1113(-)